VRLLFVFALVACQKDPTSPTTSSSEDTAAVAPNKRDYVAVPRDRPNQKILVALDCNRWPHPPDNYFYQSVTTYDLDTSTWSRVKREGNDDPVAVAPGSDAEPKVETSNGNLDAERVAAIKKRLDAVLKSGPYEPRYPPSGGSRCTLQLLVANEKPFFEIDRADEKPNDEVTKLIAELRPR
jgi:hypothetical protein